ncbi:MAG: PEGA domain-containing protein [Kofleriaceae bacterium]|nr:PEGA domain-containing protein [Kofleriaceae bacterium]
MLTLVSSAELAAAPKNIAILNMSTAPESAQVAAKARQIIDNNPELRTTNPGDLSRALEGMFPLGGPDVLIFEKVDQALELSEQAFSSFKPKLAKVNLEKARALLFSLPPSRPAYQRLADLSFQMALIHLRDENRGLAIREFHLLHKLDARESIDPVRYAPDVVKAFTQSRAQLAAAADKSSTITVSATYDGAPVYLNGKLVGNAPIEIAVVPGTHLVAIAAPQYQAVTRALEIDPDSNELLRFDLKPRSPVVRALNMRYQASQTGLLDDQIREVAARTALLVGSDAVLVLIDKGDETVATLYDQRLDRLSFNRPVDESLDMLLGLVIETPRPGIVEAAAPIMPTLPWYRSPLGIAAIGGGTAITIGILGVLTLSGSGPEPFDGFTEIFGPNPGIRF